MDLILKAAREEFNGYGFAGATTKAIARRADVTEAQLFRYFPSKTELFREAVFLELNRHFAQFQRLHVGDVGTDADVRELSAEYIHDLQEYFRGRGRLLFTAIVAHVYKSAEVSDAADMDGLSEYFARGAVEFTQRSGGRSRIDPRIMVRISFAAVLATSLLRSWLFPDGLASEAEIDAAISDFVIEGISGNQAAAPASGWSRPPRDPDPPSERGDDLARRFLAALSAGELPDGLLGVGAMASIGGERMDADRYRMRLRLMRAAFPGGAAYAVRSLVAKAGRILIEADATAVLADGTLYRNRHAFALDTTGGVITAIAERFDPEPVRTLVVPLLASALGDVAATSSQPWTMN